MQGWICECGKIDCKKDDLKDIYGCYVKFEKINMIDKMLHFVIK